MKKAKQIEEWLNINGFPNYKVSNLGRIAKGDRMLKIMKTADKYPKSYVELFKDKKRYRRLVSRLVYQAFSEDKLKYDSCRVYHIDGNKDNCCFSNLRASLSEKQIPSEEQIKIFERWCFPTIKTFIKDMKLNDSNIDVDNFFGESAFLLWKYLPLYKQTSFITWAKKYLWLALLKELQISRQTRFLEMKVWGDYEQREADN